LRVGVAIAPRRIGAVVAPKRHEQGCARSGDHQEGYDFRTHFLVNLSAIFASIDALHANI
jgi:hypothetical protein